MNTRIYTGKLYTTDELVRQTGNIPSNSTGKGSIGYSFVHVQGFAPITEINKITKSMVKKGQILNSSVDLA